MGIFFWLAIFGLYMIYKITTNWKEYGSWFGLIVGSVLFFGCGGYFIHLCGGL